MSKPWVSTDDNISPCAPIFSAYWVGADDENNPHNKALNAVMENAAKYAARQRQLPGSFAESLVQLMKEQKMTVEALSDRSLVGVKTIQRLRNDEEYPTSKQTILALCIRLRLSPTEAEDLFDKTNFKLNTKKTEDAPLAKKKTPARKPKISEDAGDAIILHLAGKKAVAHGYVSGDAFIVLKGSEICPEERASCREWIKIHRKELIDAGTVKDGVFTEDTTFSSPSAAAACIVGGESNEQITWITDEGVKLKDL